MLKLTRDTDGTVVYVNPEMITHITDSNGSSCKVHWIVGNEEHVAHAAESIVYKMSKKTQVFKNSSIHSLNHDIVNFLLTNILVDIQYAQDAFSYSAVVVYR